MRNNSKFINITLLGGAVVTTDMSRKSKCFKCKKPIVWAVTSNAKNMPICQDEKGNWISHFSNCAFANDFRHRQSGDGDMLDELIMQQKRQSW